MPKLHTRLEDLITRLLVLLGNLLAIWRDEVRALDHVLQTDISESFQKLNIRILLHGVARLLDECQVLLQH